MKWPMMQGSSRAGLCASGACKRCQRRPGWLQLLSQLLRLVLASAVAKCQGAEAAAAAAAGAAMVGLGMVPCLTTTHRRARYRHVRAFSWQHASCAL